MGIILVHSLQSTLGRRRLTVDHKISIMKILSKNLFFFIAILSFSTAFAQDDFEPKYVMGKNLYTQGRYSAAMEILKPLTNEAEGNRYVQYAHYYYALAAFKSGAMQDAYMMLLRLTEKYRDWEKIDEAYYLLGNVAFEQKKPRSAMQYLEGRKKELRQDIENMKAIYLEKVTPVDTLINLQRDYPTDEILANALAKRLALSSNEKQKMLLEYLVQEYKLDRDKFIKEKKSVMKPAYNVAVLFPFMLKELNATSKPNQFAYDMYEGIRMALDSLKRKGIKINLYAYDTDKEGIKTGEILNLPELKTMDLIIGPVYPAQYSLVNEFGLVNQIVVINPLSNNLSLTEENSYVYLFQPSLQSYAGQAANYARKNFFTIQTIPTEYRTDSLKKVIIFQSPTPKDSLLARSFSDSIKANGFEVNFHEVVNRDNISRVSEILKDSLMLTKVSHLFVSSTDQVLAANIISSMEISGFKIPVVTGSDWLQFSLLTYDQFERREVHFLNPDFIDYNSSAAYNFRKAFMERTNSLPSTYSYHGFELMHVFGKALFKHGNYFVQGLQKDNFIQGSIFQGFNYTGVKSNGYIPVVKFIDAQLTLLNHPKRPYVFPVDPKKKGR